MSFHAIDGYRAFIPSGRRGDASQNDFKAARYGVDRTCAVPEYLVVKARYRSVSCGGRFHVRLQAIAVHHVDAAVIASRPRAEQCGMSHTSLEQRGFAFPQTGYDLSAVHTCLSG
jgi:hypothetical protein